MNSIEAKLSNALEQISVNTRDKIAILQNELLLGVAAAAPSFTGVNIADVHAIEIRVRQTGTPADSTQIARITFVTGDAPTTTHGMYLGNGDLYTVTGNKNVRALKIISADGAAHTANFVFYNA